jgi:hypothetical protein
VANQAAWNQGWAIGARGYGGALGRSQQLNEEEFKAKATELGQQLGMLRQKLAQHPEGSEQHSRVVNEMQSRIAEIRKLYHPAHNPGAIQRFAHLLTDALKLTSPQARIKKEAARRAAASTEDEHQAQEMDEAAPEFKEPAPPELDPEEIHRAARVKAGLDPRATAPKPMAWKPVGKPIRIGDKVWQQEASPFGDLRMVPTPEGVEAPAEAWKPQGRPFVFRGKTFQEEANSAGELRVVEAPAGVRPPLGRTEKWKKNGPPAQIRGRWMLPEISENGRLRFVPLPKDSPEPKSKISKVPGAK